MISSGQTAEIEAAVRIRARTSSRLAAVQALYQIGMTGRTASLVVDEFLAHRLPEFGETASFGAADESLFRNLTLGTASDLVQIDKLISKALVDGWRPDRLENTLCAIIRVGVYELLAHRQTPDAVVISEYMDVTHAFYDDKAAALVNGVLDQIARTIRSGSTDG